MKKLILALTAFAALSLLVSCGGKTPSKPADTTAPVTTEAPRDTVVPETKEPDDSADPDFTPVIRFTVTSDIHQTGSESGQSSRTRDAVADAYALAAADKDYQGMDLFCVVGDIADNGYKSQLTYARSLFDKALDYNKTQLFIVMGNHDYYEGSGTAAVSLRSGKVKQFVDVFGDLPEKTASTTVISSENGNIHYVVNGFHFIGISSDTDGWSYSTKTAVWLDKQLKAAQDDGGKDKPIFTFHHIGNRNTILGTQPKNVLLGSNSGTTTFDAVYAKYPQVVCFSGHSHKPINDECSIYQDKYTCLGTGTLNYSVLEAYNNALVSIAECGTYDNEPGQIYIVEADADGRVRIRMYDISKNRFIGETYLLDSYDPKNFKYTADRLNDAKIFFDESAKITINSVSATACQFNFNVVSPDSFTARNFKVVVTDKSGKVVSSKYMGWKYYDEDYTKVLSSSAGGLEPDTEYTVQVYGISSGFNEDINDKNSIVSSNCLSATFRTKGGEGYGPATAEGEGIAFTVKDYYTMKSVCAIPQTWEFKIKVAKDGTARNGEVICNYRAGGTDSCGIDIRSNGKVTLWWGKAGAKDERRISFDSYDCRTGKVIDVAVTSDLAKNQTSLYIDGSLVQTLPVVLYDLKMVDTFFFGGDYRTANSLNEQYLKNSTLYYVALYSDVRTEDEIVADRKGADLKDPGLIAAYDLMKPAEERVKELKGTGNDLVGHGAYAPGSGAEEPIAGQGAVAKFEKSKAKGEGIRFEAESYYTMKNLCAIPYTFEFTIEVDDDGNPRNGAVICNYRAGNSDSCGVDIRSGGKLTLWWGQKGAKNEQRISFDLDCRTGKKMFVAITVDKAAGKTALYIDGEFVAEKSAYITDLTFTDVFMLGGDHRTFNTLNEQYLKSATLYDLTLFSDIRTADEIKADMKTLDKDDKDLIASYDLTGSAAERTKDISGKGHDLVGAGYYAK